MRKILVSCNLIYDDKHKNIKIHFEKKLIDFFLKLNLLPIIISPNDDIKKIIISIKPNLVVLSGGNNLSSFEIKNKKLSILRDRFEKKLINISTKLNIPILGICRGMQLLNNYYKGVLTEVNNHVNKRHRILFDKKYKQYFASNVNSFHNFGISKKIYP